MCLSPSMFFRPTSRLGPGLGGTSAFLALPVIVVSVGGTGLDEGGEEGLYLGLHQSG